MKLASLFAGPRLVAGLACVTGVSSLMAQSPTITLGPEINLGATYESGAFTQYQSDLRCDPLNPLNMAITCKYTGETKTAFFRTTDGGTTWNASQVASSGDPDVLYDNDGGVHRIFIDLANAKRTGYLRSLDGGATFEAKKLISSAGVDHMHMICDRTTGPTRGNLYVAGVSTSGPTLYLMRSTDRGVTWNQITYALPTSVGRGFVHDLAVMNDGALVISIKSQIRIFTLPNGSYGGSRIDMFAIRSTDGGQSVSAPVLIGNMDNIAGSGSPSSRSFAMAKGMWQGVERLYNVSPKARAGLPTLLQISTSDDGGLTWTALRDVVAPSPANWGQGGCMSVMVNAEGTVGIQFFAFKPGTIDQFDLYFTASVDGGATFSTPTRISTATSKHPPSQPREPGGDQVYADVAADGSFRLVWPDARNNASKYNLYHRKVEVQLPQVEPVEIIMDNNDTNGVVKTGQWVNSTVNSGYYASNYCHDNNTQKGTKSVRFTPTLPYTGTYDVYMQWSAASNRASNVPVDITHAGGVDAVQVNQRVNGGAWVLLGSYSFTAGTAGNVLISTGGTNGYVIADGVRFVRGELPPVEEPAVEVITDNSDSSGITRTGDWVNSTVVPGFHGSNYMHDNNTQKGTKSVRFTPTLPSAGTYDVYMRWASDGNRANNVPVDITYSGGVDAVQVDQQLNGGTWVLLGSYPFAAGTGGSVLLSTTGTSNYVIADAVKFVLP